APFRHARSLRQRDRRVHDHARRGEIALQRGDVDKGLDRRAGLAARLRPAVELARPEVPAADIGEAPPGLRIHDDDGAADIGKLAQAVERRGAGEVLDQNQIAGEDDVSDGAYRRPEPLVWEGGARPLQLADLDAALRAALQGNLRTAAVDRGDRGDLPGIDARRDRRAGERGQRGARAAEPLQRSAPAMPAVIGDEPIAEGGLGDVLLGGAVAGMDPKASLIDQLLAKPGDQLAPHILDEIPRIAD